MLKWLPNGNFPMKAFFILVDFLADERVFLLITYLFYYNSNILNLYSIFILLELS